MKFQGKVAMITGASVGIGRAVALCLAEQGADLVLLDINKESLLAVGEEAKKYGCRVLTYDCDVSDEEKVNEVTADAAKRLGKIDILVNNAALWRDRASLAESSSELWKKYLDINIMGVYYCTRAVICGMIENGYGRNRRWLHRQRGIRCRSLWKRKNGALLCNEGSRHCND